MLKRVGQRHISAVVPHVPLVPHPHATASLDQRLSQHAGKHHHTILVPLPAAHDDLPALKIQVAQAKGATFHHPQTAAIQQLGHQPMHRSRFHCFDDPQRFIAAQDGGDSHGPMRSLGLKAPKMIFSELVVEHLLVEEDDRASRLILAGGAELAIASQMREERFDIGGMDVSWMPPSLVGSTEAEELLDPHLIALDGDLRQMPPAANVRHTPCRTPMTAPFVS